MFTKRRARWVASETPKENFIRLLILFLVFLTTVVGFWWNFQRQDDLLSSTTYKFSDSAKFFNADEKKAITSMSKGFKDKFALKLVLDVLPTGALTLPDLDSMSIYLGVSVEQAEALIDLPPWLVKLVGEQYINDLEKQLKTSLIKANPKANSEANSDIWRQQFGDTILKLGQKFEQVMER